MLRLHAVKVQKYQAHALLKGAAACSNGLNTWSSAEPRHVHISCISQLAHAVLPHLHTPS